MSGRDGHSIDIGHGKNDHDMEMVELDMYPVKLVSDDEPKYDADKVMIDGQPYPSGAKLATLMLGLCLGNFLVALDMTIITTAIPKIVTDFKSLDDVGWYASAYLLTLTALQPPWGKVFTYFNVKWTYLVIISIFELGSIICAAAKNSDMFTIGRAIAGIGAAGLFQGSLTIIGMCVPLSQRPIYIAIAVSVFGVASCFGPILGGGLTDSAGWAWCFWINAPIGAVAVLTALLFINPPARSIQNKTIGTKLKEMDLPGTVLLIASMTCLFLALQFGGFSKPWSDPVVVGLLVGFGILLVIFIFLQHRLRDMATIPFTLCSQRTMLGSIGFLFLSHITMQVHAYYIPFYFQAVQNVSALQSGIRNIPSVAMVTVGSLISGTIITLTGHYMHLMYIGAALYVAGSALIGTMGVGTNTGMWIGYQFLAGGAIGLCVQIPFSALHLAIPEKDMPTGNATLVFFQQLGGAIAVSIAQNIFTQKLRRELEHNLPNINASTIIDAGLTEIETVAKALGTPEAGVIKCYEKALQAAFILGTVGAGAALLCIPLMQWMKLETPKEKKAREDAAKEAKEAKDMDTSVHHSRESDSSASRAGNGHIRSSGGCK